MTDRSRSSVGERIVSICLGALVCAITLTLAVDLLSDILGWLIGGGVLLAAGVTYVWWLRRW